MFYLRNSKDGNCRIQVEIPFHVYAKIDVLVNSQYLRCLIARDNTKLVFVLIKILVFSLVVKTEIKLQRSERYIKSLNY